jgi:TonB family protein
MERLITGALLGAAALCFVACAGAVDTRPHPMSDVEAACGSHVLPNNPDVVPPHLIHGGHPKIPARGPRSGFVCVRATVNESGQVIDPKVVTTDNKEFAENFLRALPDWKYQPATRGSAKVTFHITLFAHFPS